ncbi:hypothetical protein lerEdw1_015665 [Lerista edwardsae]|nr:hypothetical protein lerEdw1_010505 [Lerista edwardsae]KAJ6660853.1 hypothetical protein lerEdw1_017479 [Lerista edwardsae]KAJ6662650.1 hypothetical protein lerEdw1_011787 [Lerista edwardsae]KAJ6668288.1 hypothetical protein lerEdw1_015665 [Lerista edwardsae]
MEPLTIKKKRSRKPNFTVSEIELMTNCVSDCRNLDSQKIGLKEVFREPKDIVTAWNEVARKLNSVGPTERTGQECKEKWFDLKTRTKKKAVEYKEFVNKTGNKTGKCPKPLTELENRIYSFIDESTISGISQGLSTFQPCSNQAESLRSPGQPRQILAELDVPVQLQQVPTELDVPVQPQQILMELDVNVQQDAGYALCLESPSPSSVLAVQLDTPHEQLGSSSRMREINDETLTSMFSLQ